MAGRLTEQMKKFALCLFMGALPVYAGGPQVTIYNDDFGTVKEDRVVVLTEEVTEVRLTGMSRHLEPDSVMLRELAEEPFGVRILEQSFIHDPLTEGLLLHQMEGREVRFEEKREDGTVVEHVGKLIRSGYRADGRLEPPIVEEAGAVRFSLPGQPVFEGMDPKAFLQPSLVWQIASAKTGECPVEVAYLTGGLGWEATYNLVAPAEGSDRFDLTGWISLRNDTGKTFEEAEIKLIAGDVQKESPMVMGGIGRKLADAMGKPEDEVLPEERSFDEFHLYTLPRPVLLRNNELKQVEFVRATGVKGSRYYVYEPLVGLRYGGGRVEDPNYGLSAIKKVGVRIEVENTETNGLGVPLPKGRLRLYRTDAVDGRREFAGENEIGHLPKNEKLTLAMGDAFDLVGERVRTDFQIDTEARKMTESVEIKLRNRKANPVEIRVVEKMTRGANWKITLRSQAFEKIDAQTVEFRVAVPANDETTVKYTAQYWW